MITAVAIKALRNGVYSSKWRPAARGKGGGHSQTRGRAGVTEMSGSTCVGSMSAESSSCPTIIFHCRSLPVIPRCGHQMCSVIFLWRTWLEKQAETTEGYLSSELGMSRSIKDDRSRSRVRASFLYMHCEPQELFFVVVVSAVLHFTSFPFFFVSSIVALHKH